MKKIKISWIISFLPFVLFGQSIQVPSDGFSFGTKGQDHHIQSIKTKDGHILSIGTIQSPYQKGYDGYLLKINAQGKSIFKKSVGTKYNDEACTLTEDDNGFYYVGYMISKNALHRNAESVYKEGWVSIRNPGGIKIRDFKLIKKTKNLKMHSLLVSKNSSIIVFYTANKTLHLLETDMEGNIVRNEKLSKLIKEPLLDKVVDLKTIKNEDFLVLALREEITRDRTQLRLLRFDKNFYFQETKNFVDIDWKNIGGLELDGKQNIFISGTADHVSRTKMDIAIFRSDIMFQDKYLYKEFQERDDDIASDLALVNDSLLLVLGNSVSFKPGAQKNNFCTFLMSTEMEPKSKEMVFFGNKFEEKASDCIQLSAHEFMLCGTQDIGSQVFKNDNLYFHKLIVEQHSSQEESIFSPSPQNIQMLVHQQRDMNELGKNKTITYQIELSNSSDFNANGIFVNVKCNDCQEGLYFTDQLSVPSIKKNSKVLVPLNIWTSADPSEGINQFEVEVFYKDKTRCLL